MTFDACENNERKGKNNLLPFLEQKFSFFFLNRRKDKKNR